MFFNKVKHAENMERIRVLTAKFKDTLSHKHATVHFIGVWYVLESIPFFIPKLLTSLSFVIRDTVSSVGLTRGPNLPETVNGMSEACGCRHAISLDERRGKFLPEYLRGGSGPAKRPLAIHLQ